jgi:hypothetical protein
MPSLAIWSILILKKVGLLNKSLYFKIKYQIDIKIELFQVVNC